MTAIPTVAAIRFGYGLSPSRPAPADAAALLAGLTGPDQGVAAYPQETLEQSAPLAQEYITVRAARRAADKTLGGTDPVLAKAVTEVRRKLDRQMVQAALTALARAAGSAQPFRERLARFWGDHFTVRAKNLSEQGAVNAFADAALRPHLAGRFGDMLVASTTHPAMLIYLDQTTSFGPNSPFALRHKRGLNENLAREVLELHSLGVQGGYSQADVTAFANLLTGLSYTLENGFQFRPAVAEPGAEVVLGKSSGGTGPARLEDIQAALHDIAIHPDTARHLARKLAVHFIADTPDDALVAHMTAAYAGSGGDLTATYTAMLEHPAAWADFGAKAKQPFDFLASALRALDVDPATMLGFTPKEARQRLLEPMRQMGQPFAEPSGPNGWPEEALAWINPQGLAGRIQWAMQMPETLAPVLPDPRSFVTVALADAAGALLVRAAAGAEAVAQGVGLVLASPEFNRR